MKELLVDWVQEEEGEHEQEERLSRMDCEHSMGLAMCFLVCAQINGRV